MFLVVTILFLVELPVSRTEQLAVWDPRPIDPDCKPPDVCSMLYFFDSDNNLLGEVLGTNKTLEVRNVVKVGLRPEGPKATIFNVFSFPCFEVRGNSIVS